MSVGPSGKSGVVPGPDSGASAASLVINPQKPDGPGAPAVPSARRPKRRRQAAPTLEQEEWDELVESMQAKGQRRLAPAAPLWPAALVAYGEELQAAVAKGGFLADVDGALGVLRALRLALAGGVENEVWLDFAQAQLDDAVQHLGGKDEEFAADLRVFSSLRRSYAKGPMNLRPLQQRAALDSLHFALWALQQRTGCAPSPQHPADLADEIQAVVLSLPRVAEHVRGIFACEKLRQVARSWGLREAWLTESGVDASAWRPGGCDLLRVMRSRWCEAASIVAMAKQPVVADSASRAAVMAWHCAGRDSGARWMSFAVPSRAALKAVAAGARKSGLVEFGCRRWLLVGAAFRAGHRHYSP